VGLKPAEEKLVFNRFWRADPSRARQTGGTGLGLSIVKHVLGLHGAQLRIDSEVGRGSTFGCVFGPERVLAR
jgi:two-component system phosphate regulon sensor histidine kinase PhoR